MAAGRAVRLRGPAHPHVVQHAVDSPTLPTARRPPAPATTAAHPPPLPPPCLCPVRSPFDSSRGRLALGLAAASGGGMLLTNLMQQSDDPKRQQILQLVLVFWCAWLGWRRWAAVVPLRSACRRCYHCRVLLKRPCLPAHAGSSLWARPPWPTCGRPVAASRQQWASAAPPLRRPQTAAARQRRRRAAAARAATDPAPPRSARHPVLARRLCTWPASEHVTDRLHVTVT